MSDERSLSDLAQANVTLIERLMRSERVVEAARRFVNDPASVNGLFDLDAAVDAYDSGAPS